MENQPANASPQFRAIHARLLLAEKSAFEAISAAEDRQGIGKYSDCPAFKEKDAVLDAAQDELISFEAQSIGDVLAKIADDERQTGAERSTLLKSALRDLERIGEHEKETWNRLCALDERMNELQGLIYALDALTINSPIFDIEFPANERQKTQRRQHSHGLLAVCRELFDKASEGDESPD